MAEHEALFYKKLKDKLVHCQLCPQSCVISPGNYGKCKARKNINGKLYSMVYAQPVSVAVDSIEKKPLFHMLPGTYAYSIGTTGCNMGCLFCQNSTISQAFPEDMPGVYMEPKDVVENAVREKCFSIAYTYTEPSIGCEYVLDTAILAKKKKLKNIMVTNGFINPEPAKKLYKYIDAANVDLKGFTEDYYKNICFARLQPVLETLKLLDKMGVWIEITNLIIPGLNDDMKKIEEMCEWIKKELGTGYPLHFSRFFPCYKMMDRQPTPFETLKKAYQVAKKVGIKYVYVGNVPEREYEHTYCPKCKETVIKRTSYFQIEDNKLKNGSCPKCKTKIEGVWK
ncbi:MAG: AmmeMemoRadiSam system radical SAM enzyme [Nanoarchaeota archaeon]|nr:AmmeMemoRadiSam system radical SAM enzyme [Nanoarchaeota archaeon]